jgi:DNA repair protein RadC
MAGGSKVISIKNWPVDDRPREKLLKKGAKALSNSELLAILLREISRVRHR